MQLKRRIRCIRVEAEKFHEKNRFDNVESFKRPTGEDLKKIIGMGQLSIM